MRTAPPPYASLSPAMIRRPVATVENISLAKRRRWMSDEDWRYFWSAWAAGFVLFYAFIF